MRTRGQSAPSRRSGDPPPADRPRRSTAYARDLAAVHEDGFSGMAVGAAPALLALLARSGIRGGLVVDLGCGPGHWAAALNRAGYRVLGIDVSPAMLRLARRRAPGARFRAGSLFAAPLPGCAAVTALGECFNYLFDRRRGGALAPLFRRIHDALEPGGLLVFDVAEPGRAGGAGPRRHFALGQRWAVLVEAEEDAASRCLTRRIETFHRRGSGYRRSSEVHRLRLFPRGEVLAALRAAGFRARTLARYGDQALAPGCVAFVARKPRQAERAAGAAARSPAVTDGPAATSSPRRRPRR